MMTRTFDHDGSHARALATLPSLVSCDAGDTWDWACPVCRHAHHEDDGQIGAVLTCDDCGKEYVDEEKEEPRR